MIDVIIPVYNGEKFIIDALSSVEKQTLKPHKVIVVDDGSVDNTKLLVEKYIQSSSLNITYIKKENGGPNAARNKGIMESTSDFLAFLDADDLWVPEKLAMQMAVYTSSSFENIGLLYCRYNVIDEEGQSITDAKIVALDKTIRGAAYDKVLLSNKILSSASGVLIPRKVFNTVGYFDENLRYGEDWDMWIRIAKQYEIDFADSVLVHIRRHSSNATANDKKAFMGELEFYRKWIPLLPKVPQLWADRLIYKVIRRFPKTDYAKALKDRLPLSSYKALFSSSLSSPLLHAISFSIRYIFKIIFSKR